jgi:hypothetical protein
LAPQERFANAEDNSNPALLQKKAEELRAASASALSRQDTVSAAEFKKQADDASTRAQGLQNGTITAFDKDTHQPILLPEIAQNAQNSEINKGVVTHALEQNNEFTKQATDIKNALPSQANLMQMLIQASTGPALGHGTEFWNKVYDGVAHVPGGKAIMDKYFPNATAFSNASAVAQKAALAQVIVDIQNAHLQRAVGAAIGLDQKLVPSAEITGGGRYELAANLLANQMYHKDMTDEWSKYAGTAAVPLKFQAQWNKDHPISEYMEKAKQQIPKFSDMSDEEWRQYGPKAPAKPDVLANDNGAKFSYSRQQWMDSKGMRYDPKGNPVK